ncbi:MAG: DUF2490 domain-containing protein [Bacteroidia bacterium]
MRSTIRLFLCFFISGFLFSCKIFSQIGAEAQGGKTSIWAAIGIDQELSTKWLSVTDIGYGRHSDPDNYNFTKRIGLNVLTQDFIYKPSEHWRFALSFGYWKRYFYSDDPPYDNRTTPYSFRNEVRPFQKIIYHHSIGNIKLTHTLRTDFRFYYNQYFTDNWTTLFEFRLRYMENWKFPLSQNKKNWFIAVDEILSAVDLVRKNWSPYQLTENRFSLYYRRSFPKHKADLDLGIMHQYWRDKPGTSGFNTSYNLMIDIIFIDPFSKKNKKEEKDEE